MIIIFAKKLVCLGVLNITPAFPCETYKCRNLHLCKNIHKATVLTIIKYPMAHLTTLV